jgi:hypothetical protein
MVKNGKRNKRGKIVNLELTRERQEASKLFCKLLNLFSMNQGGICIEDHEVVEARALLVRKCAEKLLGESWDFPVKT